MSIRRYAREKLNRQRFERLEDIFDEELPLGMHSHIADKTGKHSHPQMDYSKSGEHMEKMILGIGHRRILGFIVSRHEHPGMEDGYSGLHTHAPLLGIAAISIAPYGDLPLFYGAHVHLSDAIEKSAEKVRGKGPIRRWRRRLERLIPEE